MLSGLTYAANLSNDANRFTASVVVGYHETAPDTVDLTVLAPCVERDGSPGASAPRLTARLPGTVETVRAHGKINRPLAVEPGFHRQRLTPVRWVTANQLIIRR
ncbi:hypothetical protein [Kitasatospora sp. NPDC005856]|uniref:hypothetical protein n=1 Tax=Kitasatospora sp. NPDC005856 TaxID=3154566 RepID=UPI0033F8D14F